MFLIFVYARPLLLVVYSTFISFCTGRLDPEPETKNNEIVAMTDNEAANILLKKLNDDYNICVCEGNKYMKVNNIWINDEKLIEQNS